MSYLNFIPLPYRIVIIATLFVAYSGFMFYGGWKECSIREQAKQKEQALVYAQMIVNEQQKGDKLSTELKEAQTVIEKNRDERKKNVSKVTTGRECLSSAAVGLLRNQTSQTETSGGTNSEDAGNTASDADVTNWAIEAQTQYGICAKRLNKLIDWFNE